MTVRHLPVDSDLAECSVAWAVEILGETPRVLWVTNEEYESALAMFHDFPDLKVKVDDTLTRYSWALEGETHRVESDGA